MCPKTIVPQKIFAKKTGTGKFLGLKTLWVQVQKKLGPKYFGQKKFGPKNFSARNFLSSKFQVYKKFGPKEFMSINIL